MPSDRAPLRALAVYCGSSQGTDPVFAHAATSLGHALAEDNRPLIYGGGSKGIMGVVSEAVLAKHGQVTGVVPAAMLAAGGEGDKTVAPEEYKVFVRLSEPGREGVEVIVVQSMHERKVEMAKRACGFVGLPGGFGTFEEIFEAITWTQLGIHNKPVLLLNVKKFYEPIRALIEGAINSGFIRKESKALAVFVDGPEDLAKHGTFDWGTAALQALDQWGGAPAGIFAGRWGDDKSKDNALELS
ncbi:hypothetical protein OF83DRAFT_1053375 [Amylostereum chailletii]|nr:hypothetical protein OF83DRAFT_1053375 [Amylostereum chailletii]